MLSSPSISVDVIKIEVAWEPKEDSMLRIKPSWHLAACGSWAVQGDSGQAAVTRRTR